MAMDAATSANRLRIAAVLMHLPEDETRRAVAAMAPQERTQLTGHINWVQDYEATENPTLED